MIKYLAFSILISLSSLVHAQSELTPKVRSFIEPDTPLYAGQVFTLYLEVKVPTWLLSSPTFPDVSFDDAFSIQPEQLGENFVQRKGGHTYSGLRQRFLVVSHKVGDLEVPSYDIAFSYADDAGKPVSVSLSTEAISLPISALPISEMPISEMTISEMPRAETAEGIQRMTVARDLSVTESFTPKLEALKVGDAITRVIVIEADQSLGFTLPEILFEPFKGVDVYPAQVSIEDELIRGQIMGRRIESASYLMQREGMVQFPEMVIEWFNLDSGEIEQVILESREVTVAESAVFDAVDGRDSVGVRQRVLGYIAILLTVIKEHANAIQWGLVVLLLSVLGYRFFWITSKQTCLKFFVKVNDSALYLCVAVCCAILFKSPSVYLLYVYRWQQHTNNQGFKETPSWQRLQAAFDVNPVALKRRQLIKDVIKTYLNSRNAHSKGRPERLNP